MTHAMTRAKMEAAVTLISSDVGCQQATLVFELRKVSSLCTIVAACSQSHGPVQDAVFLHFGAEAFLLQETKKPLPAEGAVFIWLLRH